MTQPMKLTDVLESIHNDTEGENIKVSDVVESLEDRGYGPLLLTPSLFTILPTGMIPGVPTVTALLIIFIAGQILAGRKSPWLPRFLRERKIKRQKFEAAREKAEPYIKKFDALLKPRLEKLVSTSGLRIVAALCIVLAATMPFLEIIPFAAILPALAIAIMSLGFIARDGYAIVLGLIVAVAGLATSIYLLVG
ncbi:MAG: exopolysaccharide biosynthesis protein [Sneathiella sp.]